MAAWAALEIWPSLAELTLVEVEPGMIAAGRALPDAAWVAGDIADAGGPADLVVASARPRRAARSHRRGAPALAADRRHARPDRTGNARRLPPRPRGAIGRARRRGPHGRAVPTDRPCPLPADDWCHFAVRLPRSKLHRRTKGVELGYEDEKLSYAALTRGPVSPATARIIRRPQVRSGHVNLVTCEADGIHARTVSRKDGSLYRCARGAAWGDVIELGGGPRP